MNPLTFSPRRAAWLLALSLTSLYPLAHAMPPAEAGVARPGAPAPAMRHLDALKARLQLSPAQEGAWSQFAQALTARPAPMAEAQAAHEELLRLPTPQRIERMKALRAQQQARMNAWMDQRSEASLALYAALSDAQKKVFDEETARQLRERHGARHRHGGPGGHHGHSHG